MDDPVLKAMAEMARANARPAPRPPASVAVPAPLGPSRPTISPHRTSIDMPFTTVRSP